MITKDRIANFDELVYNDREDLAWLDQEELIDLIVTISDEWIALRDYLI